MLLEKLQSAISSSQFDLLKASLDARPCAPAEPASAYGVASTISPSQLQMFSAMKKEELVVNLDIWSANGFPTAVSTCVVACCRGEHARALRQPAEWSAVLCAAGRRNAVGLLQVLRMHACMWAQALQHTLTTIMHPAGFKHIPRVTGRGAVSTGLMAGLSPPPMVARLQACAAHTFWTRASTAGCCWSSTRATAWAP